MPGKALNRLRHALSTAFSRVESVTTTLRTLVINLAFMIAFFAIVPLVAAEMFRDRVTVESFAVPESFAAIGFTGDVVANRVWDGLQQVYADAGTSKERLSVLPESQKVEFSVPDSGVSFEALIYHVRRFFNLHETKLGGEFVCAEEPCTRKNLRLRIRLMRGSMDYVELPPIGDMGDDAYFRRAAAEILRFLDPFVAASYLYRSDPGKALVEARKIARLKDPNAKWALNLIGNIMSDRKVYAEAVTHFQAALALDPGFKTALVNLARAQTDMGKHEDAIKTANRAIGEDPEYAVARMILGRALAAAGRPDDALAAYAKATELDPLSPWPRWQTGYLLMGRGDFDGASKAYNSTLETDPDFLEAHVGLASLASLKGDWPLAVHHYKEMVRIAPQDAASWSGLAGVQALAGEKDAAVASYREALRLDPGNALDMNRLATHLRDQGKLTEALALLADAITRDGAPSDAWFNMGDVLMRQGKNAEARAALEDFIRRDPASPYAALAEAFLAKLAGG